MEALWCHLSVQEGLPSPTQGIPRPGPALGPHLTRPPRAHSEPRPAPTARPPQYPTPMFTLSLILFAALLLIIAVAFGRGLHHADEILHVVDDAEAEGSRPAVAAS